MILKAISLNLNTKLEASDIYLPLTASDTAYLTSVVPEGEEIYLTIQWDMYREYVLASNEHGTIVLTRGVDSEARAFPKGSCVFFENSVPVTKWLICNYECCSDDCGYEAVQNAGAVLPAAKVGDTWKGTFIFKGAYLWYSELQVFQTGARLHILVITLHLLEYLQLQEAIT